MPKIVIKEQDNSSASSLAASNFSVMIAGKIAVSSSTGFDSNGICECHSISDFNTYIGKVEESEAVSAKGPTLTTVTTKAGTVTENWYGKLSDLSFETISKYIGYFYERQTISTVTAEGKYIKKIGDTYYEYGYEDEDGEWVHEPVETLDEDKSYSIITTGNEGQDAATDVKTYGNKMAYELLKQGYNTVYYKKIDDELTELTSSSSTFWDAVKDKSLYNFRYITHGLVSDLDAANTLIDKIANDRGDCIALLEVDQSYYASKSQSEAITTIRTLPVLATGGKYSAYFAPYVEYASYDESKYTSKFPACFHYLACAIKAQQNYNEWYAVAGYTRGISDYTINNVGCKFGDSAASNLQPRIKGKANIAVNLILSLPEGYYLWGNRTAANLTEEGLIFSHFLNIRQLCCTLKKQLYTTCRQLTYDPNSDTLWLNFCGANSPLLEKMKTDQGITNYKLIKLDTSYKGKLYAAVRIVPIEAVEDFEIGVVLEDSLDNPTVEISDEELGNYNE